MQGQHAKLRIEAARARAAGPADPPPKAIDTSKQGVLAQTPRSSLVVDAAENSDDKSIALGAGSARLPQSESSDRPPVFIPPPL